MKKLLFVLLFLVFTNAIEVEASLPHSYQVVKPDDDIKSMYQNEQYQEIIDRYAARPRSLSAEELIYVAQSYLRLEDMEGATIFSQMAIQKDPKYAEAYYVDGVITNMIGNHSQAIIRLRRAITLSPDQSDYYIALGDVYYAQEKYNEALSEYKRALKVPNPSEKAYYMIGVAYMGLNDEKQALEAFYEAKEKNVNDKELYVTVLYNIGKTEYDNRRYKIALVSYKELIDYFPDDYYSYEKLVQCHNALKEYDDANKNKEVLYSAHSRGQLNGTSLADMFGIEDFLVNSKNIQGYERYEDVAENTIVKNIFYVLDSTGNIESSLFLEYTPDGDNRIKGSIIMTKGAERFSCGVKFSDRVSYPVLKQAIVDIVSGKIATTPIE